MSDSWVAIDFETANEHIGSVCAVGLVRVARGEIVERFTGYVKPHPRVEWFDPFNVDIHHITPEHVATAPRWPELLPTIVDFIGADPVLAHNAEFDIGVIREACDLAGLDWPRLDYACTVVLGRRLWPESPNHKLATLCERVGHDLTRHHDAGADAEAAACVLLAMLRETGAESLPELCARSRVEMGWLAPGGWRDCRRGGYSPRGDRFGKWADESRAEVPAPDPEADPAGPLFGQTVCITDPKTIDKQRAWELIARAGGQPAKNVTRRTTILVTPAGAERNPSAKYRRALEYRAKGQPIEIISEEELAALLGQRPSAGLW